MVEFEKKEEAQLAIDEMDGSQLLEQDISVKWAFVRGEWRRPVGSFAFFCMTPFTTLAHVLFLGTRLSLS